MAKRRKTLKRKTVRRKTKLIRNPDSASVYKIFRTSQKKHKIDSGDVDFGWWGNLSHKIETKGMSRTKLKTEVDKYYKKNKKYY